MKKVFVVLVVGLLLVFSANCVMAKGFTVGADYLASGSIAFSGSSVDLSGFAVNGEYVADSFKVGLDYRMLKIEDNWNLSNMVLKGGYKISDGVYATLSYDSSTYEDFFPGGIDLGVSAILVGVESSFAVSNQITLA
jgi:hypothetical protein